MHILAAVAQGRDKSHFFLIMLAWWHKLPQQREPALWDPSPDKASVKLPSWHNTFCLEAAGSCSAWLHYSRTAMWHRIIAQIQTCFQEGERKTDLHTCGAQLTALQHTTAVLLKVYKGRLILWGHCFQLNSSEHFCQQHQMTKHLQLHLTAENKETSGSAGPPPGSAAPERFPILQGYT